MKKLCAILVSWACILISALKADDVLYRYDGDVLPFPDAGWWEGNCTGTCHETLEDGFFVIRWDYGTARSVSHAYLFATQQTPPPPLPPFWVEWRFLSNHRVRNDQGCDALFYLVYRDFYDVIYMFGDAVLSSDAGTVLSHLPINEFRTYRFESLDGLSGCFVVDGILFSCSEGGGTGYGILQMFGRGGCDLTQPATVNKWDFVRYGTISYGEAIVAVDPPGPASGGFLDARVHAPLDRFTVTFEEANYVYVDEIAIDLLATEPRSHEATEGKDEATEPRSHGATKVTAVGTEALRHEGTEFNPNPERERRAHSLALGVPTAPAVTATRRLDNGPPEVVEIVLDRPISYNATTRFTFNDGTIEQTVELTFAPGDTDGDGDADLADFAALQNCFGHPVASARGSDSSPLNAGVCQSLDRDGDAVITALDFAAFPILLARQ